jgi:hypothetical protein
VVIGYKITPPPPATEVRTAVVISEGIIVNRHVEYRAMLALDIERSSGRGNVALLRIREVLFDALRECMERSGIDWRACVREDLGDGMRVIAPPAVRKPLLLHPFLHDLAGRLRTHNQTADLSTRIRVRVALHAGDLYAGSDGVVSGHPLEVLARLLDATPARDALARSPQSVSLAALMSQHFYDETVPHGYDGIDADTFHQVAFTEKEYTARAWLHLPQSPVVPALDPGTTGDDIGDDRAAGSPTMINNARDSSVLNAVQNGAQHIHHGGK